MSTRMLEAQSLGDQVDAILRDFALTLSTQPEREAELRRGVELLDSEIQFLVSAALGRAKYLAALFVQEEKS